MSLYDGTGNDINIAGFKTTNIALKNTPQQNPKEFKTKTEKQAKENDGKTSSIINLIDEIDTTLYVINDKLDETPEIMLGKGRLSGGVLTIEGLTRMKIPEIKDELKKRGLKITGNKTELVARLENYTEDTAKTIKVKVPQLKQKEVQTQTEPYTYGPPPPLPPPPSDVFLRKYNEDRAQDKKEEYYRLKQATEEDEDQEEEEEARDDDFSSSGLEGLSQFEGLSSYDGSALYDPNAPRTASDDGGDDYDGDSSYNKRQTPSSRNDLNSNIMKLEEQVDRLYKLTKGINSFINFSNPVEVEKLNNSSKKIVDSSNGLKEHLNDITPINKIFETKMNSIINKIELEYNKINSALNGYTYTFMEGGNMHNNHILDFMNSSKKRFY